MLPIPARGDSVCQVIRGKEQMPDSITWIALCVITLVLLIGVGLRRRPLPAELPDVEEDVRWAYRRILEREPESRAVVKHWAQAGLSRAELIESFANTTEFALKSLDTQRRLLRAARQEANSTASVKAAEIVQPA